MYRGDIGRKTSCHRNKKYIAVDFRKFAFSDIFETLIQKHEPTPAICKSTETKSKICVEIYLKLHEKL